MYILINTLLVFFFFLFFFNFITVSGFVLKYKLCDMKDVLLSVLVPHIVLFPVKNINRLSKIFNSYGTVKILFFVVVFLWRNETATLAPADAALYLLNPCHIPLQMVCHM